MDLKKIKFRQIFGFLIRGDITIFCENSSKM